LFFELAIHPPPFLYKDKSEYLVHTAGGIFRLFVDIKALSFRDKLAALPLVFKIEG